MADRLTARVNLRLSEDTFDAFKSAADAINVDVTSLVRQCVDASAPSMRAVAQSVELMKEGHGSRAAGLFTALLEAAAAQGRLGVEQARALEEQLRAMDRTSERGE